MKYVRLLWPWVVAIVVLLAYGCEREANGVLRASVSALTHERDALAKRSAVVRREFVHDTVTLTRHIREYHAYVDSLRVVDTLTLRETVIVAAADTAIHACTDVIRSCAENLHLADSLHFADQRLISAYRSARPSFVRRWGERLAWGAVGYTIGTVTR